MKRLAAPLATLLVLFVCPLLRAQVMDPVGFTFTSGTTGDGFFGPALNDTTSTITIDGSAYNLFTQGQNPGDLTAGTPTVPFLSQSNTVTKIATFQFQSPTSTNILKFNGTLSLSTPEGFSNVAFLVQSLGGSNAVSFTLNFSDATSETLTTAGAPPYWVGGDPTASGGTVALGGVFAIENHDASGYNGSPLNFIEYDFALASSDIGKTVDSVSVNANSDYLITYGMSGTVAAAPEPSTWAMLAVALGIGATALLRRVKSVR